MITWKIFLTAIVASVLALGAVGEVLHEAAVEIELTTWLLSISE